MIIVFVGKQDGVEVFHPGIQHLLPEVGPCVHGNIYVSFRNEDGGTQAFIPGVGRAADSAFTSDDGYAL